MRDNKIALIRFCGKIYLRHNVLPIKLNEAL